MINPKRFSFCSANSYLAINTSWSSVSICLFVVRDDLNDEAFKHAPQMLRRCLAFLPVLGDPH